MRKAAIFLVGIMIVVGFLFVHFRLDVPQAQASEVSSGSADATTIAPHQPIGWVFGRLIGVQQSVYPRPAERTPMFIPPNQAQRRAP